MLQNTIVRPFEMKNLPLAVDVVVPLWSPPVGDDEFKRFDVEYIIRNNIAENDYQFELIDESQNADELLAAAFLSRKGDVNKAKEWFDNESKRFPAELLAACALSRDYICIMDERTLSLMNDDDIKLSFFASRKPGAGGELFNRICDKLHAEGWKKLYLWTDCDCNWNWYNKHGLTLVEENVYEPFSSENEDYKTFIFSKPL